jgi:signal transduction histidine kinase
MIERAREAGLSAEVEIEGTERDLAPGIELTAYRLVQEALTNALKHAGPTTARVLVRYGEDRLDIEVVNDEGAPTSAPRENGTGHGLSGMQERLTLYGGVLEAGPRNGGYAVRAHIPLTGTPA